MSILFCTPAYGAMVFAPHYRSCMALTQELTRQGVAHDWLIRWNESLVHRARMGMTKTFLDETGYTHMMWLDADIEFDPGDVAKLWNMNTDIAVGVYRMKTEDSKYAAWINNELVTDLDQFKEPIECDYAGTGFMMISRKCLETLAEKVPSYENEVPGIPALYMTPLSGGTLMSEDYFFCELAREHGFRIMMDPSVRLTHWGVTGYGVERGTREGKGSGTK